MAAEQVEGGQINAVLNMVREMSDNGDVQLSILGRAFVVGCKSCQADLDATIQNIRDMWDDLDGRLVPLHRQ